MATTEEIEANQGGLRCARARCLARAAKWEREAARSDKATWERAVAAGRAREADEIATWIKALMAHLDSQEDE